MHSYIIASESTVYASKFISAWLFSSTCIFHACILHTVIVGAGHPSARQTISILSPIVAVMSLEGSKVTVGAAIKKNISLYIL